MSKEEAERGHFWTLKLGADTFEPLARQRVETNFCGTLEGDGTENYSADRSGPHPAELIH